MPRRQTAFYQGQFYHIYNRGAGRRSIFREADNYLFLLERMKEYAGELCIAVIAYCLMPNHYHFLLRQDSEEAVGLFPQRLFNGYTKAFNKRYGRTGTLFEGPYKAKRVAKESYLLQLCCYIHANPIKHGLVSDLRQWPYSNYLEWTGARNGALVDRGFVSDYFATPARYRQFVLDYVEGAVKPQKGIEDYFLE